MRISWGMLAWSLTATAFAQTSSTQPATAQAADSSVAASTSAPSQPPSGSIDTISPPSYVQSSTMPVSVPQDTISTTPPAISTAGATSAKTAPQASTATATMAPSYHGTLSTASAASNYVPPIGVTPLSTSTAAQTPGFVPPLGSALPSSLPGALTPAVDFGTKLDPNKGPWALGEVRFVGNHAISEFALQSKVRAKRGSLYMPEDVGADEAVLMQTGSFDKVAYDVYEITDQPVPEGYASIAVSTHMVRLVFSVVEKPTAASAKGVAGAVPSTPPSVSTAPAKLPPLPPAAVSGVVWTPTAYRGLGKFNSPGLGLDFNGVYYIGRLYGKNNLDYTTGKTNYLDRVGQWFLMADGKMQVQSETTLRPAVAAGAQGIFSFRDAPQPNIQTPTVTASVSKKTTRLLTDGYFVASKKFGPVRSSIGIMEGNAGDFIGMLSEFLSDTALTFSGHQNQTATSKTMFFASLLTLPKPQYPLAVEFIKPPGMASNPYLLNFKIGYFLHTNFDIAFLKFNGGYDLLGMFQFRVNYFPSR